MSTQRFIEPLWWETADGTAVANTTTETIIFPNKTIQGSYLHGERCLMIKAAGRYSTTGSPTGVWALRWGGVGGTVIATTEALTLGTAQTNLNWWLEAMIQTRSNGATGTVLVMGTVHAMLTTTTVLDHVFSVSGGDAPAATTVDLTADTALSLTFDWSAASASNTLTGHLYSGWSFN